MIRIPEPPKSNSNEVMNIYNEYVEVLKVLDNNDFEEDTGRGAEDLWDKYGDDYEGEMVEYFYQYPDGSLMYTYFDEMIGGWTIGFWKSDSSSPESNWYKEGLSSDEILAILR